MVGGHASAENVIKELSCVVKRLNCELTSVVTSVFEVKDKIKKLEDTDHSMSPRLSPIKADLKRCFDEVAKLTADQMEMRQSMESSHNDIQSLSEKMGDITQSLPNISNMQSQVSALENKISLLQTNSENKFQSLLNKIDELQTKVESIDQVQTWSTPSNQLVNNSIEEEPASNVGENAGDLNMARDYALLTELRDLIDSYLEEVQPLQRQPSYQRTRSRSYSSDSDYKSLQSQSSFEHSSIHTTEQDNAVFPASPSSSRTGFELPQSPTAADAPGSTSTPFYKHHSYHNEIDKLRYFLKEIRRIITDKLPNIDQ